MPSDPIQSPHAASILAALCHQGSSNDCGPFTTATVVNALRGLNIDPAGLAREMNRPVWHGPLFIVRRIPNWATFPWGIADVLRRYGLKASWRFRVQPEYLIEALPTGAILMPVIGSWRPLWAHVMTLVAWDPVQGWGFANTQTADKRIDWLGEDVFRSRWRAMGRLLVEVKHG